MNKKALINGIKEHLELKEFKAVSVGAGSVSLVAGRRTIGIGYTHGLVGLRLPAQILGKICFSEVEDILEPYFEKYGLGYQPYTIYKSSRRFEHLSSIDLYSPGDIQKVGNELNMMVYEDILPFFEEFQDIQAVLAQMESLAKEEISKFICHSPVPRMMIIKKIGGSKDWKEFCEWAVDIHSTMAVDSKDDHLSYLLISELYAYLQTI